MVVFTCNHCGESLQKPRVEKHYNFGCRREKFLTCVDCLKDFKGEEYVVHTKCITEEERYSAKGSIPKGVIKKGEVKQESWMDMIQNIVNSETNLKPSVRNLLNTISTYSNVPRKKGKFINFLKSSTGGRATVNDIEAIWDVIEKHKSKENNNAIRNAKPTKLENNGKLEGDDSFFSKANGSNKCNNKEETTETSKNKRKCISESEVPKKLKKEPKEANGIEEIESNEKFSFKGTILDVLNEKKIIRFKKLQKKVLAKYAKETGNEVNDKTIRKYEKKLRKVENIIIDEESNTVKLQNVD